MASPPSAASLSAPRAETSGSAFLSPSGKTNIVEASFATPTTYVFRDKDNNNEDDPSFVAASTQQDQPQDSSVGFWRLLSTLYLPLALVWLRRLLFGTANLVRSLFLGRVVQALFARDAKSVGWWEFVSELPWLQPLLSADPHAWPPPAFTILALLTIVAFVVHPDGLTWILLGKIRDGVCCCFHSLGYLGNMHGILPTLVASATLSALVVLVWIVYRTSRPKRRAKKTTSLPPPCPKKKKRKGGKGRQRHLKKSTTPKQREPNTTTTRVVPETTTRPKSPPFAETLVSANEETKPARARIVSTSTLDTCPLGDDQSCDGMSVRSISSAPTTSVQQQWQKNSPLSTTGKGGGSKFKRKQQHKKRKGDGSSHKTYGSEPKHGGRQPNDNYARVERDASAPLADHRGYSSSFFSQPNHDVSQSFFSNDLPIPPRYHVVNYNSSHGRYTPEKLELAAFLARVGLVGTACAGLLCDLPDVDALEWLSPSDYQDKYHVSCEKQREIFLLLQARRNEKQQAGWTTNDTPLPLRPPPGLSANNNNMVVGMERAVHHKSTIQSNDGPVVAPPVSHSSFSAFQSTRALQTPNHLVAAATPFVNLGAPVVQEQDDSQIEQELQELGGQMVTSVLDF